MAVPRPLPKGGISFTHQPSVAAFNFPAKTFLSTRSLVSAAATGALVFSSATGEDRVLLIQRAAHDSMPLLWEIPGGACDPEDETVLHGVARELWEEAGLKMASVVRQVGGDYVFLTRKGLGVARVTFEVEVETQKEKLPDVVLDPNEHARPLLQLNSTRDAMGTPPRSLDGNESFFDSARPFKGVVVCCTSVPTELRADIAAKTTELGGQHKYDLTPDCTHLIVGDYNTAKYRHVAKARPDVRVMTAAWVEAVRNLWVQDVEIDFLALEKEWQLGTFEAGAAEPAVDGTEPERQKLLCCLTGFDDPDERQQIIDKIESNGGLYASDLTKRVTHLIVYKPEGRKYQAAKKWGVVTVSAEWVTDSVERGLILDEKLYDPVLAPGERGVGAWNREKSRVSILGKRLRENNANTTQDEQKRKLRKTASMKLNSQRDNLWGDILGKPQASEAAPVAIPQKVPLKPTALPPARPTQPTQPSGGKSLDTQGSKLSSFGVPDDSAVFASCCFYVHGFSAQKTEILVNTAASLGGLICHSFDEVVSTSGAQLAHRFLIVPQTSAPETHPRLPDNVHIITEFYIERCLHKKYFFDPSQQPIGRPFPVFPIPGFEGLTICTAGFTGVDLNQVDKSIRQLGAKYEERFTANVSLLVCPSLSAVRKQKLELSLAWKVPVVSVGWLWECISTGLHAPIKRFLFPELKQNLDNPKALTQAKEKGKGKDSSKGKQERVSSSEGIDKDLLRKPVTKSRQRRELDESAFVTARGEMQEPTHHRKGHQAPEHDSNATTTTHFETAPTHAFPTNDANISFGIKTLPSGAPLSETSFNSLNKTPTTPRRPGPPRPRKPMSRITSEVADSEATDGDVGEPNDLPLPDNQDEENAEEPTPRQDEVAGRPDPEAEEKRLEAEKAKAERLAISTKLVTSLLDSTTPRPPPGMAATTTTTTVSAPAAPISFPGPDLSGGGDDTPAELGAAGPSSSKLKRRKRNIFGRAISNVSAASSTTSNGDSSSTCCAAAGAGAGAVTAGGGTKPDTAVTAGGGGGGGGDAPPAATQLEYEDPEARRYKEQLMSKMMGTATAGGGGGGGGVKKAASFAGTTTTTTTTGQEKLTLAGMGGYDLAQQQGRYDAVAGGTGRRSTRRR
ncbi:hypothetical protein C8A00DRAFT_43582 [Chaetomidium leptoderma]|uniref:Uncharacterized protein n=1 Tax=Chaetomidium leptoderma TaxID=669021 RepID=A0AAN6VLK2_9PEZI|nr:hypothetical protein C8A00DRAFT_43582 [Chaetomidium leptoderma]